ncbi:MAG TPA: protein-disulfide reductase DsbD domain-containing protein [Thermoanaerobaculia bacterium]|nr:protein-disulfide reductase DsbD domain-containing protein [Thermoanaerobaculia bacterium]
MTRPRALVGALFLLLHAAAVAAQVHDGKTIVDARLLADTAAVEPGRAFTAAVHLSIAPRWHVYWENPGDTALPVQVQWELPEGTRVSPLQWPRPQQYREKDGITVFGYEQETVLLARITPPRSIGSPSFEIHAKADWLVCENLCIPGEAALSLTLPVGDATPSNDASLIRGWKAKVPTAARDVRIADVRASRSGARWSFQLDVETGGRRTTAFYPRAIEGFRIKHSEIRLEGNRIEFHGEAEEQQFKPRVVSGVLITDRGSFDVSSRVSTGAAPSAPGSSPAAAAAPPATVAPPPPAAASTAPPGKATSDDWLERDFQGEAANRRKLPLWTLILFSALGGLLLNIMPCVLPVISLKILSFVHQAGQDERRTRLMGMMFAAGVIASFWMLVAAVIAVRSTAEQIGWGFQFQSPLFVVIMSAVVLLFALNLFGVFEIAGPALAGDVTATPGLRGAFLQGVLATILATPCTAPFLGTAIGFAMTQSPLVLFIAFTAAGAGLALPYVLLSWNTGWLRRLPKPGAWMERFKQSMGFLLVATVIWLLSVLGSQLGPEGVVWTLAFLTVVAFAAWVYGQKPTLAGRIAAAVLIAGGYLWALEYELRWRQPVAAEATGTVWHPFSLADLRTRVERGETVFVDFTADWCWSCKVNERTVLSAPAVEKRMRELRVTTVKADWTRRNPEITRLLAKFGRAGVPFYVVFPANRLTSPIALSEVITPASVTDALERAGPSQVKPE